MAKNTALAVVVLLLTLAQIVLPADYPTRSLTIIVAFPPGGSTDVQARIIAKGLADRLRVPVIVENRPGSGGRTGTALAARVKPDGYTFVLAAISSLVIYPTVDSTLQYEPYRDFIPIVTTVEAPFLLVVPATSSVKNAPDLITHGKERTGITTYIVALGRGHPMNYHNILPRKSSMTPSLRVYLTGYSGFARLRR